MSGKKALLLASLFAANSILAGCGGGSATNKILYASHTENKDFTANVYNATESRVQDAEFEFVNSNRDVNLQIDQVMAAVDEHPAAIVLVPVDAEALIPAVKKANNANIPVIATNRDLNGGDFVMVKSDDKQAGQLQGEYMAKNLPQNAKVVYLMGESTQGSAQERFQGFKEACLDKRKDVTLLAKADANWSEAEAVKFATLWMTLFPQIDGVIAGNDTMALGAMKTMLAAGRKGFLVSGVDAKGEAVEAIKKGVMHHSAKQNADKIGEQIANAIQKGRAGNPQTGEVRVPFSSVTIDTLN